MTRKSTPVSDKEQVTQHIQNLPSELAPKIQRLREIILTTDSIIGEQIKWNNPCFYYTGEMKPYGPKEYKREIIVMNLFKGRIMLVFPSGAKVQDRTGFLQGDYKDGRRTLIFTDEADIDAKASSLQELIRTWLSLVEH